MQKLLLNCCLSECCKYCASRSWVPGEGQGQYTYGVKGQNYMEPRKFSHFTNHYEIRDVVNVQKETKQVVFRMHVLI